MGVSDPQVSVLMPVHNAQDTLEQSVASVRTQSFESWELWIANDASEDGSGALAEAFAAQDPRIHVLHLETNGGAAAARNAALARAQGRYIAFLDADDLWHPDKLAKQVAFMQTQGAALSFTAYARMAPSGALISEERVQAHVDYKALLRRNLLGCLTVIYDSAQLGKVEMPDLTRQEDYALWLRLVRAAGGAHGLDEVLAIYRVRRGTLSANKLAGARDIWRIHRDLEGLGRLTSAWNFIHYAWHGLRRRLVQRADPDAPLVDVTFGRKDVRK